jgi:hypothetical protein
MQKGLAHRLFFGTTQWSFLATPTAVQTGRGTSLVGHTLVWARNTVLLAVPQGVSVGRTYFAIGAPMPVEERQTQE